MIRAVCFDLGGVLIQIHHRWLGAAHACGLTGVPDLGPLGGFPEFHAYQNGDIGRDEYLRALARELCVTPEVAMKVHMAVLREEYPGVTTLVQELVSKGIVCGCLSNTNESHWETFFDGVRYGFGALLTVRIGSHIEKASKPGTAIFEAFERGSRVSPEETVYFDDGAVNVEAARRRGWTAHLIDPQGDTADQMRRWLGLP